ncbi:hypothetical protein AAZX31_18G189600 [Glycine max]
MASPSPFLSSHTLFLSFFFLCHGLPPRRCGFLLLPSPPSQSWPPSLFPLRDLPPPLPGTFPLLRRSMSSQQRYILFPSSVVLPFFGFLPSSIVFFLLFLRVGCCFSDFVCIFF